MIVGERVSLRPLREEDWTLFEEWGQHRNAFWGSYQRFQLDHIPQLREAYQQTGLLQRDGGFLLIERNQDQRVLGFVRYTMLPLPDADHPYPEIGFGLPEISARGSGYCKEAVNLLVDYLFAGYATERIGAFTEVENVAAQGVLESVGFSREGVMRRVIFRDGSWRDVSIFSILRGGVIDSE